MNKNTIVTVTLAVIATAAVCSLICAYNKDHENDANRPRVIQEMQHEADEMGDQIKENTEEVKDKVDDKLDEMRDKNNDND